MTILNFLKICKEILRFLRKFFKILTKLSRKFREILESFGNMDLQGVWGGGGPLEPSENIKKLSEKINGNLQNFEDFQDFVANFDLQTLILIKIKRS